MKLSVVIPAYNESKNIKLTTEEILSITEEISGIDNIQVVVVDDHSSDSTFDAVKGINDARVSCIRLSRRSGSHTALRAGIREADGDAVLCICADGQDNPNSIPEMIQKWQSGAHVVWAVRKSRENESWRIRIPATLFYKLLSWFEGDRDSTIDLDAADFWLLDRMVVDAVNTCIERNTSLFGLVAWSGFNQDYALYDRRLRRYGKSKWNFRSRLRSAKDWIIAFSGLPLKLMPVVGFFIAMLGFLYAIYIIINYFIGNPLGGWSTMMVIILFLGGIQMIMIGVIGEYLWRNLEESRMRPLYFIEKQTSNNKG